MRSQSKIVLLALLLLSPRHMTGQAAGKTRWCAKGRPEITLGIVATCIDCVVRRTADSTRWMYYTSRPTVAAMEAGARASIRLRRGDVVLAVNGADITTEQASRAFSRPTSLRPVKLAIRRGSSDLEVTVTPIRVCSDNE